MPDKYLCKSLRLRYRSGFTRTRTAPLEFNIFAIFQGDISRRNVIEFNIRCGKVKALRVAATVKNKFRQFRNGSVEFSRRMVRAKGIGEGRKEGIYVITFTERNGQLRSVLSLKKKKKMYPLKDSFFL